MSNQLAIAAVTATFGQVLARVADDLSLTGVTISTRPPDTARSDYGGGRQLNLFLYQTTLNSGWRTVDLPFRTGDGVLMNQPVLPLNLHYILTAYGQNDDDVDAHHLLGLAMSIIHDQSFFTRDQIRRSLQAQPAVAQSDLAEQPELIKITPHDMTTEELFRLWSAFQTPYRLSAAYEISVVMIERPHPLKASLPVRATGPSVGPGGWPTIEAVTPQVVTAGSTLTIRGRQLGGGPFGKPAIRFGDVIAPAETVTVVSDGEIAVIVPAGGLYPGVNMVQLVQTRMRGVPPVPDQTLESNAAPFVLRPTIMKGAAGYQIVVDQVQGSGAALRSARLTLQLSPVVGPTQRALALLNEVGGTAAYSFGATPRNVVGSTIIVPITGVQAGRYLVRVRVDQGESPLDVDAATGYYNGPAVTIP